MRWILSGLFFKTGRNSIIKKKRKKKKRIRMEEKNWMMLANERNKNLWKKKKKRSKTRERKWKKATEEHRAMGWRQENRQKIKSEVKDKKWTGPGKRGYKARRLNCNQKGRNRKRTKDWMSRSWLNKSA